MIKQLTSILLWLAIALVVLTTAVGPELRTWHMAIALLIYVLGTHMSTQEIRELREDLSQAYECFEEHDAEVKVLEEANDELRLIAQHLKAKEYCEKH